jgi:hypothetical protein
MAQSHRIRGSLSGLLLLQQATIEWFIYTGCSFYTNTDTMTTLALSQIPSGINTVEQIHAWSGLVLRSVSGTREVTEQEGYLPQRIAVAPISETPSQGIRMTVRASLEMVPGYDAATTKLWKQVKEQVEGTIPAAYLSN